MHRKAKLLERKQNCRIPGARGASALTAPSLAANTRSMLLALHKCKAFPASGRPSHCQGDEGHTLALRRGQISSPRMVHEMSH